MKLSTGVSLIAASAVATAYAEPPQASWQGDNGNSEAVQVQWVPKAQLVYKDSNAIRFTGALSEYINKIVPIDFNVAAVLQGFDGTKYLPYLRTFKMKTVLDTIFQNTKLDDVANLLDALRKMDLETFLPIGLNMLARDQSINGQALFDSFLFKPFSGEIVLDSFAKMDLTTLAKILDQPDAIAAFMEMTGVDLKPTIGKLYGLTGAQILSNYGRTTGTDVITFLDTSGIFDYFELYLGMLVRDAAKKVFGSLTGQSVLQRIRQQETDVNRAKFAKGDFFAIIDQFHNSFLNAIREPWIDGTIVYPIYQPQREPVYHGYNHQRNMEAMDMFLAKIIGFQPMDHPQWVRGLDYAQIKATISGITGATLADALKSASAKMGPQRTQQVVQELLDVVYRVWTFLYGLDGDQLIAILETATGQRIEEAIRGLAIGPIARTAHEAYVHEIVRDVTALDIEPILLDLGKIDMNAVVDGWASLRNDDFFQLLVDRDLFNYLATYAFNTLALSQVIAHWSGQAFIDWVYAHDGPWYLASIQTWDGPVVIEGLNELFNRCGSLFRQMTEGSLYSTPDLQMTEKFVGYAVTPVASNTDSGVRQTPVAEQNAKGPRVFGRRRKN